MANSAQDDLFGYTEAYYATRSLLAAWRIGLLDATHHDQVDIVDWAAAHDFDPDLLRALADYLVLRDLLERDGDAYRLSERARAMYPYLGYLPSHVGAYEPIFNALEDVLARRRTYGGDLDRSHQEVASGMSAMEEHLLGQLTRITDDIRFHGVVDLGCGSARLLSKLLAREPGLRGVGIDHEEVACAEARRTLEREGLSDRAMILRGDATRLNELPAGTFDGIDLAIAMFVMHEVNYGRTRDEVVRCLRGIAEMLGPEGRLLMVEVSRVPADGPRRGLRFVPEYQLTHEFSHQRLIGRDDWESMLAEAGMKVLRTEPAGICEAFCFVASVT